MMSADPEPGTQEAVPKEVEAKVLQSYMAQEVQEAAIQIAEEAVTKHKQLKAIAEHVKKAFDDRFPTQTALEGVYHCIAGYHFACCITHDTRSYIHLLVGQVHIVIFRSKDLPFDPNFKPKGKAEKKAEGEKTVQREVTKAETRIRE